MRLNGRYGKEPHRRQMYRCFPSDGSPPHNFAGPSPRFVATETTCPGCENPVASHEGPRAARRYDFPVAQAVAALVMVGQGVSYTEAADRTRVRNHRGRLVSGAQLVGNWVEVLGPVVTAAASENSWPETVVLDSTWFQVRNTWTGTNSRAFSVLGAYGYPAGGPGRTWALHATPQARSADWQSFLRSLPGEPRMVICDSDRAIRAAVKKVWPHSFVKLCEHHLRVGAIGALGPYGLTAYGDPVMELLNEAFHTATAWRRFAAAVKGRGIVAEQWVEDHDEVVRSQARRRRHLPQHHSTGALDEVLAKVREFMEPRAFCYRNAERTNRMLELVRLRLNRADDPTAYAAAIRAHLDANGGQLLRQGTVRDPKGQHSLRV